MSRCLGRQLVNLLVLAAAARSCVSGQTDHQAGKADGSEIRGGITDADGRTPLGGAKVTLGMYSTMSSEQGIFVFQQIPPGTYSVRVERNGYVMTGSSIVVVAEAVPVSPLWIRMIRAASIAGVVEDEDQDPVADVTVALLQERTQAGERVIGAVPSPVLTGPDGGFSFAAVAPGRYYLRASASAQTASAGAPQPTSTGVLSFIGTYYPNSFDAFGAVPVEASAGVDSRGLRVRLLAARLHTIGGHIRGLSIQTDTTQKLSAVLQELAGPGSSTTVSAVGRPALNSKINPDGSFSISRVGPGSYRLVLESGLFPLPGGLTLTVGDKDVAEIELHVPPSGPFSGKILFPEGKRPAGDLRLILQGVTGIYTAKILPEGTFAIENAMEGKYRVLIYPRIDMVIVSIDSNGRRTEGSKFDLRLPDVERALISLSLRGSTIAGTVEAGKDGAVKGLVSVTTAPVETMLDAASLRTARIEQNGTFSLDNLEPGQYRVCAWIEEGSRLREIAVDPQYQQRLDSSCATAKLKADERGQVRLKPVSVTDFN